MVSASSAQREPSMEEILASIRRIIEDNESGRKPSDLDAGRSLENTVIEVDAFRADLRAQAGEADENPRPAPPERKPMMLSEVQARSAADGGTTPRWTPETTPEPRFTDAERMRAGNASPSRHGEPPLATDRPPVPQVEPSAARAAEPEGGMEGTTKPLPGPVPAGARAAAESSQSRSMILSEHAERKVAAAFGELSDAFAARSRRTFDELAAEMLQPMLQDWLDNNLPSLVERLVREEIERVARGA
jgi:hypothetical protein